MLKKTDSMHIYFEKLVKSKIPALSGVASDNNRLILKSIALDGVMLKYDVFKDVNMPYYTVSRRVDNLVERGYLAEAGKRVTERGKQTEESTFGLTWRGFLASITIIEVRENILQVLRRNPLLDFPEKESVLSILGELATSQELEIITKSILEAFLKTIPDLELIENEPMSLLAWFLSIKEKPKLPPNFRLGKIPKDTEELLTLLDKPSILRAVKEILIPLIQQKTKEIENLYHLFRAFNVVGDFISGLEAGDKPSKRLREFIETESRSKLTEQKIPPNLIGLSEEE